MFAPHRLVHLPKTKAHPCLSAKLVAGMLTGLAFFDASAAESVVSQSSASPGVRWTQLPAQSGQQTGFTLIPAASAGLRFTNRLDEATGAANRVLYNGAGLAVGDYDGDGRPDLFLCNLNGQNALFHNEGQWRFTEVTATAGLADPLPESRGAVFADLDGDGDLDLLISVNARGVRTFRNEGHGRFTDVTKEAGTGGTQGTTTLALADVDNNGTLDLYVVNYRTDDIRDRGRAKIQMVNGRPLMAGTETNRFILLNGKLEECGQPDRLLLNDGTGKFRAASWTAGQFLDEGGQPLLEPPVDWGLTATFRDVNGDGAPDLYVCNDYWTPDRLWINDGTGRFRAAPAFALRHISGSSMGVDFADLDRDGDLDFFVVEMLSRFPALRKRQMAAHLPALSPVGLASDRPQVLQNTLFLNRGDGTFAEIADFAGLAASDWSWSPHFLDVDLDGFEDLLISAGHFRDVQDGDAEAQVQARQHSWAAIKDEAERQRLYTKELMENYRLYPLLRLPIAGFRNRGQARFVEQTAAWGLDHRAVHHGLAVADFDGDGDLDLVANDLNEAPALFRNDCTAGRIAVRLQGRSPNTQAIGAKISLEGSSLPTQSAEVVCGGRYQSGSDAQVVFAAPRDAASMTLTIHWRSGQQTVIPGVQANRLYEIDENTTQKDQPPPAPVPPSPWFEDQTDHLGHRHSDAASNDLERQPLLPFRLGQLGPGVVAADLDGDRHDDLAIGSGRGGTIALYRGDGRGGFVRFTNSPNVTAALPEDSAGLVTWAPNSTSPRLLVGLTGYETKLDAAVRDLGSANPKAEAPPSPLLGQSTASALAVADVTGNGQWCLFAGGGLKPGQYPSGSPSMLYRWNGQQWTLDTRNQAVLDNLGVVNGGIWSDLDGDGNPELVLACEWGPVRVFRWTTTGLQEITSTLGLSAWTGWWRGVAAGDLNQDGRLDLVVSNWGENSAYRASPEKPLVMAFGQLAQPGIFDVIETEYVGSALAPRRKLPALANALPFALDRFATFTAYSEASLDDLLGDRKPLSRRTSVTTLSTTAFLNTGSGFTAVPLPPEAQFAPAFAVLIADYDGDGAEDVFLSQNFFGTLPEMPRLDAGTGLLLQGDGRGGFTPLTPRNSGLVVLGEQRGAANLDFDEDGRTDLVVTQNGTESRLFHNRAARPGLRLRLEGPAHNPLAIGAVIRLRSGDRVGPAREIHAGSGYWSMDSPVQVLTLPTTPDSVWIRWPGGRVTTTPIPANARELVVRADGSSSVP